MNLDPLYTVKRKCPVCETTFNLSMMRGKQVLVKQDSDLCSWFKNVFPYYYSVWVCPECGFAATDDHFEKPLSAAQQEKLKSIPQNPVYKDLSGERDLSKAVFAYNQAIYCAQLIDAPASRLAELFLKMAWIHRQNDQNAKETLYIIKALQYYEEALLKERLPIGSLSEFAVTYLIGELYRRTGDFDKATRYFSKIISNPLAKTEPKVFKLTQDAWQQVKTDRETAGN